MGTEKVRMRAAGEGGGVQGCIAYTHILQSSILYEAVLAPFDGWDAYLL